MKSAFTVPIVIGLFVECMAVENDPLHAIIASSNRRTHTSKNRHRENSTFLAYQLREHKKSQEAHCIKDTAYRQSVVYALIVISGVSMKALTKNNAAAVLTMALQSAAFEALKKRSKD